MSCARVRIHVVIVGGSEWTSDRRLPHNNPPSASPVHVRMYVRVDHLPAHISNLWIWIAVER